MEQIKDNKTSIRKISPDDGNYFFGYYDLKAYSKDGMYHLCNKTDFIDRIPDEHDVLKLGVIDLKAGRFEQFAETSAWNFQQGAMLQWHGKKADIVFYNIRKGDKFYTVEHNLKNGAKNMFPAVACLDSEGEKGLKINFSRIFDFRPGYGYAGIRDEFFDVKTPKDDGIFLVDTRTGEEKLIISYDRISKAYPIKGLENAKFVINHITFNPSGTRFLFLLRNFVTKPGTVHGTSLITSDLEGNMTLLMQDGYISHYYWKDDDSMVIYCKPDNKAGLFLVNDFTADYKEYKSRFFKNEADDMHCIFSPDRRYIIGDGYPKDEDFRTLYLYDTISDKSEIVFKVYSMPVSTADIRCDLHARFDETQKKISFDSTHEGKRAVYEIDFEPETMI